MPTSQGWTTPWPNARVHFRGSTDSTMDDARELARQGCPAGTIVAAAHQRRGRGRAPGRRWLSEAGQSLLATVVLRVEQMAFPLEQLPLRAGAAAVLGIESVAAIAVKLKWPNDILAPIPGTETMRKVAGILCESAGGVALVGFGVNCTQREFPADLREQAGSLLQAGAAESSPAAILHAILLNLKSPPIEPPWPQVVRRRLFGLGKRVRITAPGSLDVVEGVLEDIDEAGRLLIRLADGTPRSIAHGEMMAVSPAS